MEPLLPGRALYTTPAGVDVNSDTAIRMSTVYACVRLLGDTISSLPLSAYVRRGRARIAYSAVYGEMPQWVIKPNPEATRLEFYEQVISSLNLHGNAFILTVRDDMGDVKELYCINPLQVRIRRPDPMGEIEYVVTIAQNAQDPVNQFYDNAQPFDPLATKTMVLTKNEMLHIPMFRLPGQLLGLGPIAAARITLGSAMAAEVYAASYFGNAANPGGVIEAPTELTEEQISDISRNWNLSHTGPYRAGKLGILTGGASLKCAVSELKRLHAYSESRFRSLATQWLEP